MAVDKKKVFDLVKTKAGLGTTPDPDRDPVIECAVDEAEELILNYIHRNEMPSAATLTPVIQSMGKEGQRNPETYGTFPPLYQSYWTRSDTGNWASQ